MQTRLPGPGYCFSLILLLTLALLLVSNTPRLHGTQDDSYPRRALGPMRTAVRSPLAPRIVESYGKLPLSFEANEGQADGQVRFLSRGRGYTLFLAGTEAVLALRQPQRTRRESFMPSSAPSASSAVQLRLRLLGANPSPEVVGLDELPGKSNYFIGNDPTKWRTDVPTFAKVEYREVYPGINLVYYGSNQNQLEYDFVVAPGALSSQIRFAVEGADKLEVDRQGDLVLHAGGGQVRFHKPLVYQEIDGVRREIPAMYRWRPAGRPRMLHRYADASWREPAGGTPAVQEIAFQVDAYDTNRPLMIDPVLVYSSYLGSGDDAAGEGITLDSSGNVYITGWTDGGIPTLNPMQGSNRGGRDAFVVKLNAAGSALVYSTYLGGSGGDAGHAIAVDSAGNAYIAGSTSSANFPTASPLQATLTSSAAFVTKLNATGSALYYSTYLGGTTGRWLSAAASGIAVDSSGNAYVVGAADFSDFPTTPGAFQPKLSSWDDPDAFVAKLNAAGSALVYCTYLGGSDEDGASGVAIDSAGNAYVTGHTRSKDFPTAGALQAAIGGGTCGGYTCADAFVTKLSADGARLVYSSYLGGADEDQANGIAVDTAGNAYVVGTTHSANFPTVGALQATPGGGTCGSSPCHDAFVAKLNAAGSALLYSTYIGGKGDEEGLGVAADSPGNAYVTGWTDSPDFPVARPLQAVFRGTGNPYWTSGGDAFVAKVSASGSALTYSTYLGGYSGDAGHAIAVDPAGNAYVTGHAAGGFPTVSPLQAAGPGWEAFGWSAYALAMVAKLADTGTCTYSISPASASHSTKSVTGTVAVTTLSGCVWTSASNVPWLSITKGGVGTASGTLEYLVEANLGMTSRSGTLTIGGQLFTVNQAGAGGGCSYSISPDNASVAASGGAGTVTVATDSTCAWTAASNAAWITVTSGSSGNGNGTVAYSVAANTGTTSRTGTLTIGGRIFTITQAATGSLRASPGALTFSAQRGGSNPPSQTVQLTISDGSTVSWTAAASSTAGGNWLSISPASGTTPDSVSVAVNTAGLAAGSYTGQVTITPAGGAFVTVSVSLTVSESPPTIGVAPASLQFTTTVGTNPASQSITVTNQGSGALSWLGTVNYLSGSGWLSISPPGGSAPTTTAVSIDVITPGLTAGTYKGQVVVSALSGAANSPLVAPVTLTVTSPTQLAVSPQFLNFQVPQGSAEAVSQAVSITNAGSGTLNWTAAAATGSGGNWLALDGTQGTAPGTLKVTVNAAGLLSGVYLGSVKVTDTASNTSVTVIVALTVNPPATTILLSQTDFVYTAVENNAAPITQALRVLNIGQGVLNWKLLATIPSGGNWLSADQAGGSTTTDPASAARLNVLVTPPGLPAGNYYGLLIVSASGATNSPQLASVHLRVVPSTSAPVASVLPSGFIFMSVEGAADPPAQAFAVQNIGGGSLPFKASVSTSDGGPWLKVSQAQATAPATISVQASSANLRAGIYRGTISLELPAGIIQQLSVLLVVAPPGATVSALSAAERPAAACSPTEIYAVSTSLPNNFYSLVGWPVPIVVRAVDNCGNPVVAATVVAIFLSSGQAPLVLKSLRDGLYTGTWVPNSTQRQRISVKVLNPPLKEATIELAGQPEAFSADVPLINPGGVVNGASFAPQAPVSPGSIISLFGQKLSLREMSASSPLPRQLGGMAVRIGDIDAPLFYAGPGQVNAQVPVEMSRNTAASVVVTLNGKVSPPESLLISSVHPGIFTYDKDGISRGAVLDESYALVTPSNPAARGKVIQVYATGLGPTDPAVATGEPGPANPPARLVGSTSLQASIGGVPAAIQFAGLAPSFVGLYQVNVVVPGGAPAGDAPLVLIASGIRSNEVTLAIK